MSSSMSHSSLLPIFYKMLGHFAIFGTAVGGLLAVEVDFSSQITLGSIILAFLVIIIAGLITIRSKIATIWREEAEGERAAKERVQEELNETKLAFASFEKDQQEIRHNLKNELAGCKAEIKVLEAKTDLSTALEAIQSISNTQTESHYQTHELLKEIRDKLPSNPLSVEKPVIVKDVGNE